METVTAEIIEMGNVRYEPSGADGKVEMLPRGVVVQFANADEFRRAITGISPVRLEWNVSGVTPR